jgi:predicted molibdopterin-dependent oxidoreductase YjgC
VDPDEYEDDALMRGDRFPNRQGLAEIFSSAEGETSLASILEGWEKGELKLLYVIGDDLPALLEPKEVSTIPPSSGILVLQKSTSGPEDEHARMILPSAMFAEEEGSFVNFEGKRQCFGALISPYGESLPGEVILTRLSAALGVRTLDHSVGEKAEASEKPGKD